MLVASGTDIHRKTGQRSASDTGIHRGTDQRSAVREEESHYVSVSCFNEHSECYAYFVGNTNINEGMYLLFYLLTKSMCTVAYNTCALSISTDMFAKCETHYLPLRCFWPVTQVFTEEQTRDQLSKKRNHIM